MTIGRIKVEALKLMYLGLRDIHEEQLRELGANINYSDYISRMPGAINRALRTIVARQILPIRSRELALSAGEARGDSVCFHLPVIIPDFYSMAGVICSRGGAGDVRIDHGLEGEDLLLYKPSERYTYRVLYHPTLPVVSVDTKDDEDAGLPEELACLVPYYLKGDLYGEKDADAAREARAFFESGVAEYAARNRFGTQTRVKTVFGLGW